MVLVRIPDPPITDETRAYWQALGHFIHRFSQLEQQIHFMMRLYAGTTREVAQALFSGTRARLALEQVDRLREVKGLPKHPLLERAKAQFGIITTMRDDIVHHGSIPHPQGFEISNAAQQIPRKQRTVTVVTPILKAMTADLETISDAFFVMQLEAERLSLPPGVTTGRSEHFPDPNVGAQTPWQYKSPPQGGGQRTLPGQDQG
jgi:hypothetical protein